MPGHWTFPTLLLAFLIGLGSQSWAQDVDAEGHTWWKHAVFYELYPRSFADSDNNSTGELAGIASRLDCLKRLGVDAIWITPFYPSPQIDFGYDISDLENIDPMYGTTRFWYRRGVSGFRIDAWSTFSKVPNSTTIQFCRARMNAASPTCRTSTTANCPRSMMDCAACGVWPINPTQCWWASPPQLTGSSVTLQPFAVYIARLSR